MFKCPRCSATLVHDIGICQFCKATWTASKPVTPPPTPAPSPVPLGTAPWIQKVYYGLAVWWILDGIWILLRATILATEGSGGALAFALGAFMLFSGIGLLLKAKLVRTIVVFLCFLNLLLELLALLSTISFFAHIGFMGLVPIFWLLLNMGLSCLTIYVIGKTEQAAV